VSRADLHLDVRPRRSNHAETMNPNFRGIRSSSLALNASESVSCRRTHHSKGAVQKNLEEWKTSATFSKDVHEARVKKATLAIGLQSNCRKAVPAVTIFAASGTSSVAPKKSSVRRGTGQSSPNSSRRDPRIR
jgi:hypothetical protein